MNKLLGWMLNWLLRFGTGAYFFVLALFCGAALVRGHYWLAVTEIFVTLVAFFLYILSRRHRREKFRKYMDSIPEELKLQSSRFDAPMPMAVVRMFDDVIMSGNSHFNALTGYNDDLLDQKLEELVPGFGTDWLSSGHAVCPNVVTLNGRMYRVYGVRTVVNDRMGTPLGLLYFVELTDLYQIRDEYVRSRPVVSIILIDNYEELTKNLTDTAISTLNAKLGDAITAWTESYNGLLRKLERNRYLFIFEKRDLDRAKEDKFSLLENIHEITSPSGLPASISIGLGVDAANFEEGYNFAALSIEMALSRGGDQAVIKDRNNFAFFGGRNKESDYYSKVRSRVIANSLMELIGQSEHVFIMGHRNADLDALGAAVGVACLCRKKGRKVNIVLDQKNNSAQKLLAEVMESPIYKDIFVSGKDAMLMADNRSILIVVDTNRPDQVEYKPLLEAISKVCVIDHHRRAADFISPVVVNLHEPFASSASELVTEILLYAVEKDDVLPIEAKALLSGICLDTKFFNVRTGERTFEAAAALRRMGADTTEIKVLLQSDFQDTMAKYQIIRAAKLYRKEISVAALDSPTTRVLAAQAADELLNIAGITASFVMYPDNDQVIISARSIGSANVQMILEPLGGGGNKETAGCQMRGVSVSEALDRLVESIDKYYED